MIVLTALLHRLNRATPSPLQEAPVPEAVNLAEVGQAELEELGLVPLPEDQRQPGPRLGLFTLWWAANATLPSLAVGLIAPLFGLGWWLSLAVMAAFTLLGAGLVAFFSTFGIQTGLAQMPLSRFAFGRATVVPAALNLLSGVGWLAVNLLIGASLLTSWNSSTGLEVAALVLLLVLSTLLSLFGSSLVQRVAQLAWIPLTLVFAALALWVAPQMHPLASTASTLKLGDLPLLAALITYGATCFSHAAGWAPYAADFARSLPASTPPRRVFAQALVGLGLSSFGLEALGLALTTIPGGSDPALTASGPGPLLYLALGHGPVAGVLVALLVVGVLTNLIPTQYSLATSVRLVGLRVNRTLGVVVIGVLGIVAGLALLTEFTQRLETFLLLISYWLVPWAGIVVGDYVARKRRYPDASLINAPGLFSGRNALLALLAGIVAALLGASQVGYVGPLAHLVGDADLGYPVALLVSVPLYLLLQTRQPLSEAGYQEREGAKA